MPQANMYIDLVKGCQTIDLKMFEWHFHHHLIRTNPWQFHTEATLELTMTGLKLT